MAKIKSGEVLDLVALSKTENKVGDIKESMLTLEQFMEEHLGEWMLMDGQPCAGTTYESITGNTMVPDLMSQGAFLRQAKAGRQLGSYEGDAIRNITGPIAHVTGGNTAHMNGHATGWGSLPGSPSMGGVGGNYQTSGIILDASRQVPTAPENRPKNVAVNFFIKVNY